jgi:hypothetical protein
LNKNPLHFLLMFSQQSLRLLWLRFLRCLPERWNHRHHRQMS